MINNYIIAIIHNINYDYLLTVNGWLIINHIIQKTNHISFNIFKKDSSFDI